VRAPAALEAVVPRAAALVARARSWLDGRSGRERRLLALAAAAVVVILGLTIVDAVLDDLAGLRARVAARERDLAAIRVLAARLEQEPAPQASDPAAGDSLLTRLERAATTVVSRDRIASMTPTDAAHVALDVHDASLRETVALVHALEQATPPLHVVRLGLRRHADDPARLGANIEVSGGAAP